MICINCDIISGHSNKKWKWSNITDGFLWNKIIYNKNNANSAGPDQTAPQEQSDQGLHCSTNSQEPSLDWESRFVQFKTWQSLLI